MTTPADDRTFDLLATGAPTSDLLATGAPTVAAPRGARDVVEQFTPGSIVAGRYRLVSLLGRGGMGEVYRADDLTLDQPVALKFLPLDVAADDERLKRFHNELRIARQVSHRSVCRLYDLGEASGRPFLTMEYVDGEDLASLLRRIGRVPQDKAVEIARQICAGVAAAHQRGVLHRDLKPANVMIDGEGNARITDFGIATAAGQSATDLAGTPQYMAPELLAGRAASVQSDIYSLGLILFELFTGKRVVESRTLAELQRFHESGTVTTPTTIVRDLDPAVERAILRCLEREVERRPSSALVVAAALPGADPLAAALAAGETPSPDILAAAAETDALSVRWGVASVAAIVLGVLLFGGISSRFSIVARAPLDKPPAVLLDRAEQIAVSLGYTDRPGGVASNMMLAEDYLDWWQQHQQGRDRWKILSAADPATVLFWYRSSPQPLVPWQESSVDLEDPPETQSGMRTIVLDASGRLRLFRSIPPQHATPPDSAPAAAPSQPWNDLFTAAGLSIDSFTMVAPEWAPPGYADARAAWVRDVPGRPGGKIRIEAAAYQGRPVYFQVIDPWTQPDRMEARGQSRADRILEAVILGVVALVLVVAAVLARRHARSNRGDRRGAARLVVALAVAGFVSWVVRAPHAAGVAADLESLAWHGGFLTFLFAWIWVMYLALEPYVRRFRPDSLLGWSRLLAGHVRDSRVGRDLLVGIACGVALAWIDLAKLLVVPLFGYPPPRPTVGNVIELTGNAVPTLYLWAVAIIGAIESALLIVLVFVVVRLGVRYKAIAFAITTLLLSVSFMNFAAESGPVGLVFPLTSAFLCTLVAVRFGLLPLVATRCVYAIVAHVPLTLDLSHWWTSTGAWTMAGVFALTFFAFYASRAGQPLFGAFEETRA